MDELRREKKNKIYDAIRDAKKYITRSNDTIQRFRESKKIGDYATKKITTLKVSISEKQKLVEN